MHLLFPEQFADTDPLGNDGWDYDRFVENTGSKWAPEIHYCEGNDITVLDYDTARSPNNGTLQRLHELTGWDIENAYEEPGNAFEGTFTCSDGVCHNEERPYRHLCEVCDRKLDPTEYTLDDDGTVCDRLWDFDSHFRTHS